jgi:hypothetical protein
MLTGIEVARRAALREIDATPDTLAAEATLRHIIETKAGKDLRKTAVTNLRQARLDARAAAGERLAEIKEYEDRSLKGAYAIAACAWGTRLDIGAAHQQARQAPLYDDDALTPSDPHFEAGPHTETIFAKDDPRSSWWLRDMQLAVQLQGGLPTAEALRGTDSRVRIEINQEKARGRKHGTLWLRVGSEGRDPVWAKWPIKLHRAIPDTASWKWVRVSLRHEATREKWSVEITVDDSAPHPHERDTTLKGAVAVEWSWAAQEDGSIKVGSWADTHGQRGDIILPVYTVSGIHKPDGIRSVRDKILDTFRGALQEKILGSPEAALLPAWIHEAVATMTLWKSPNRFKDLARRWRFEKIDAAREAYEVLDAWEAREQHLYDYECGARGEALRERREFYRVLAARWSRTYRTILLSDQDLSREARWGEGSDVRFTAAIYELRSSLRNAFGEEASVNARWKLPMEDSDDDPPPWCERIRDAWVAGGARGDGIFAELKPKALNAWAARKAKKLPATGAAGTARKPGGNPANGLSP